jgi:hypothetical protein
MSKSVNRHLQRKILYLISDTYISRIRIALCYISRNRITRCYILRIGIARCYISRIHIPRCYISRNRITRCYILRIGIARCYISSIHIARCYISRIRIARCVITSSMAIFFVRSLKIMLRQGPFGLHAVYTYILVLLVVLCECTVYICIYCVKSFCAS